MAQQASTHRAVSEAATSRESIEVADRIQIVGEAARVEFELKGFGTELPIEVPEADADDLAAQMAVAIKAAFKSEVVGRYDVESVIVERQLGRARARVFGSDDVRQRSAVADLLTTSTEREGFRWVSSVNKAVEAARQQVRTYILDQYKTNASVDAIWVPGSGISILPALVDPDSPDGNLQDQLRRLKARDQRSLRIEIASWVLAGLLALFGVAWFLSGSNDGFVALGLGVYAVLPVVMAIVTHTTRRSLRRDMEEIAERLDLSELLTQEERRAQKLFQINSLELKRYYDQALHQRAMIFLVGVLCILSGFGVIGSALYLVDSSTTSNLSEKIVVASLGAVGGVLANFIAVIFLRMFSDTVQSMVDFHNRLVTTGHVQFGNVLIARISDDPKLKNETLAAMALLLSDRSDGTAATSTRAPTRLRGRKSTQTDAIPK